MTTHNFRQPRRAARTASVIGVALAAVLLVGCSSSEAGEAAGGPANAGTTTEPTMAPVADAAALVPQAIRDSGKVIVAIPTNEPPTQFYREGTKEMTGLNPDVARLLAGALDLDIQIEVTNFDAIIPGLAANRFDLTVSSMTPTAERMKQLDFVEYVRVGNGLGVEAGNPQKIDFDSLCGKRVAVLKGSYQLTVRVPEMVAACAESGNGELEILQFPDTQQAVSSTLSGRSDAVFADAPILAYAADKDARFEIAGENDFGNVGIGIPKDKGMLDAVAAGMQAVVESDEYRDVLASYGLDSMAIETAAVNLAQG